MQTSSELRACRVCGGSSLVAVLDLGEQALTGVFPKDPSASITVAPLQLVWCRSCTLLQLAHSCSPEELYGDDYGYRSGLNASMVTHLHRKAEGLERLVTLDEGDVVLDIGSNDGTLLAGYRTAGVTRIGIDPIASKYVDLYDTDVVVVPDFFSADVFHRTCPRRKARLVTSVAMFYDLEDPIAFAREVAETLANDGLWHFEQSYMPSMLRATSYDTVCHEHLEYYSLGVVRSILESAGLEVVSVTFNRINGGSFAITAAHEGAVRPSTALVEWLLRQERRMNLDTPAPFRDFERRVFQHGNDLRDLIHLLRNSDARVMGYGASTKGNVLLQFCGLTGDDLPAIADVNPEKHGRFTPGTCIPIISEAEMRAEEPDYLLVLPWHFRDTIIAREQEYLRSGGRLIFPLPEIEIECA